MKTLYILRHAETEYPHGIKDHERNLTDGGKNDARSLGRAMEENEMRPDLALCSTAVRTRQTLENVGHSLPTFETEYHEKIYNASIDDLLSLSKKVGPECNSLLVVGHNPSIYGLAVTLSEKGELHVMKDLFKGYNPGSLTVIKADIEDWSELSPENTRVIKLLLPQNDYSTK